MRQAGRQAGDAGEREGKRGRDGDKQTDRGKERRACMELYTASSDLLLINQP